MPDATSFIIGKWLAGKITENKRDNPRRGRKRKKLAPEERGDYIYTNHASITIKKIDKRVKKYPEYTNYLLLKEINLTIPEQLPIAEKLSRPKDLEDEKKIYEWFNAFCLYAQEVPTEQERYLDLSLYIIKKLLAYDKNNANYWYQYGLINEYQENINKALKSYTKALEINPKYKYAKERIENINENG